MTNILQQNSVLASTQINLADLGLHQLAYVRLSVIDNQQVWSIHNAAGATVGAAPTREQAVGAILQNNLTPHSVN